MPPSVSRPGARWAYHQCQRSVLPHIGIYGKRITTINLQDLTHSEDVAESDRLMQKLLSGEESSFSQEKRYIKKDGTVITGKVIVNMIRDANGNPQLGISELEDITAQKKMELALRQSEQNFRNSIDSSPMGIYIITSAWDTLYANQAFLDIFGYKNIKEVIETRRILITRRNHTRCY